MTYEKLRPPTEVQDAFSADPSELLVEGQVVRVAQPHQIPDPDARTVTIYVRKGDHAKERIISINPIPDGLNPLVLLRAGFALDGNSATLSVDPYTYFDGDDEREGNIVNLKRFSDSENIWSLTKAMNSVEKTLVTWLTKLGYNVKFG